jgi:hypothetical protein
MRLVMGPPAPSGQLPSGSRSAAASSPTPSLLRPVRSSQPRVQQTRQLGLLPGT